MSDDFQILVDLHRSGMRQGPGGDLETKQAMVLAGLDRSRPLRIADIGCGTGAASLVLARELDAEIVAVDFLQDFLDELQVRARRVGLSDQIIPLKATMNSLPFEAESFDVIWSEGAIYNMGFAAGIAEWKRFLKPGGKLVVSEITWLKSRRSTELQSYWEAQYSEVDVASEKIRKLEQEGYSPLGYFVLPEHCWLENYYRPMQGRMEALLERHEWSASAKEVVEAERREIALYEKYRRDYSYGVYVAEWGGGCSA